MRTDSTNLAATAVAQIVAIVEKQYGKEYVMARTYKTKVKMRRKHTKLSVRHMSKKRMLVPQTNKSVSIILFGNAPSHHK